MSIETRVIVKSIELGKKRFAQIHRDFSSFSKSSRKKIIYVKLRSQIASNQSRVVLPSIKNIK
jgi:hypothetical protein